MTSSFPATALSNVTSPFKRSTTREAFASWSYLFEEGAASRFISPVPGEPFGYLTQAFKGHFVRVPAPNIELSSPDRAFYTRGQTAVVQATITNFLRSGWQGALRFRNEREGTVFEQAFSVGAEASVSLTQAIPAGDPQLNPESYVASVVWRGREVAGGKGLHLWVVEPELRTVSLNVPAWSRATANPVTWTLENVRTVPLAEGSLRAEVRDASGVVWEETRPLTLPEGPGAQAALAFSVPPLSTQGVATLTLTADNGFGRVITARAYIWSHLVASASASSPAYTAGAGGEVSLALQNHGAFHEEGQVAGVIQGVGPIAAASFSLAPRQTTVLQLPFEVPASTRGGLYQASIAIPNATPVDVTVRVGEPRLQFSVDASGTYGVGDSIPVTLKNVGGSRTSPGVVLRLGPASLEESALLIVAETVTVPPGQEVSLLLGPIPSHVSSGDYVVSGSARDTATGVDVGVRESVRVSGTAATLTVSTDRDLYATGAPLEARARVTNAGTPLDSGLLHLEVVTPCAVNPGPPLSYHIDTWDGARWVERAVRHRGPLFETDLVDMAPHLPDADGEYRVRIRQSGAYPASLDYVALLSAGALFAPTEASMWGSDVLDQVLTADEDAVFIYENAVEVRFPSAPGAALVFRALEGTADCTRPTLWQKDYPLDLASGAERGVTEALTASTAEGQYILAGVVRTRDGAVLARAEKAFEVVSSALSVSVRTEGAPYRIGSAVTVVGAVRNESTSAEPNLTLRVFRKEPSHFVQVHEESIGLAAGGARNYSFAMSAASEWGARTIGLVAELRRGGQLLASSEWSFAVGEPGIDVSLRVPDPKLRLVPTNTRLVAVVESDLDAVTRADDGALEGALPFPLMLFGQDYVGFRQSVDGFVELVPAEAGGALGNLASCLDDLVVPGVAPALGDLDPTASGFVGHRFYPAGSSDRAGRVFPDDTLRVLLGRSGQG